MAQSLWLTVIASVIFPPAGIVLLWLRPATGALKKLAGTALIAGWCVAYLVLFFGLRFQLDGSGIRPIPTFANRESHEAELERNRARQVAAPIIETSASAAEPAAADSVKAAAPSARTEPPKGSEYWTDFRGPNRDGRYDQAPIRIEWPAKGLPQLWRQPIGGGYASFVIADGRAFTIEQRRRQEMATAYDLASGRELWANGWNAEFQESMGGDGPRATPTWHEGRVYAQGAQGELRCMDAVTGKTIWSRNILTDNHAENLTWGMANSPLIVDDKVVVLPGGPQGQSVVAYNKVTGEPVWKALDDKQAYTSPMLVTLAGKRQILIASAKRVMGVTTDNGSLLWEYPWTTEYAINSAQPILTGGDRVFISAGYDHGSAMLQISAAGNKLSVKELWFNKNMKNKFSSSVLFQGNLYGLDEAILACVNADTGERKWKGGRYGYGQVLLADGNLIVTTESGDLVLVKAGPEKLEEVARFSAVSGKTWNVPAIADGKLLVRNTTEMACFNVGR